MVRQEAASFDASQAWQIVETFSAWGQEQAEHWYRNESIFALGNGAIGLRGTFEEGLEHAVHPNKVPAGGTLADGCFRSVDGTYLNGFYESRRIDYPETAHGYAEKSQTMLNVPNGKPIGVLLGDEGEPLQLDLAGSQLLNFSRTLDMQSGLLERTAVWRSPLGRELELKVKRLVSFERQHLVAIEFCLIPRFSGRVRFVSRLNDRVENVRAENDPRVGSHLRGCVLTRLSERLLPDGAGCVLLHQTQDSGLHLASAMSNQLATNTPLRGQPVCARDADEIMTVVYDVDARAGEPITLHKYLAYFYADGGRPAAATLLDAAQAQLEQAQRVGFAGLEREQRAFMQGFWAQAEVTIQGKAGDDGSVAQLQQGVRFNMFHLLQAAGRDGQTNVGAKGLTGEGYDGHYFWDTEMFVAPFFQHVDPAVARHLLAYRHHTLQRARDHARELTLRGAAFPWRTINGQECSAYFPGGSAQYHLNADIAYAIDKYVQATGDTAFLSERGAEIVFETARMWVDLGDYVPARDNAFCIHGVTGPDEYSALVDNNCYTNLLAQANLRYAGRLAAWLRAEQPAEYAAIAGRMQPALAEHELAAWAKAAEKMYIPYDRQTGLFAQDDGFFNRATWRWDWGKRDHQDVLLNRFHYLVIYRHQVCKQADVVLALYLLPDAATLEEKRRNFAYYEQITTHDSSLSTCTFSIVASEIGYRGRAYDYFTRTARMDLDDHHGNVTAGVHIANMAGTWLGVVNGFGGLRLEPGAFPGAGIPHYRPFLPERWAEYSFRLRHQDCVLQVTVRRVKTADQGERTAAEYKLLSAGSAGALTLKHYDIPVTLTSAQPTQTLLID